MSYKASLAQLHVIGGRSHPGLTAAVAKQLGVTPCDAALSNFANGEIACQLGESVRGSDVFVLQSHANNVNDAIMEQAIIIDACKRSSAASISAVCPFMGYARQDKKSSGREPITSRLVIDMLANAGAGRIMSVDLHAGQIQGFFNGPFDHLLGLPKLMHYVRDNFSIDDIVIVSPDAGRAKAAERYSTMLGCNMAIVHKQRSYVKKNSVEAKYLIGDVAGKICIVIDDMIDTAGTICAAASLLQEHGAREVYGMATHGVLSGPAVQRINESVFKKVIITDTLPTNQHLKKCKKLEVVSIAPLIADAIGAVHNGTSVSALFNAGS